MKLFDGLKREMDYAIQEARVKNGPLSKEQKRKIKKQILKKEIKKYFAIAGASILAIFGVKTIAALSEPQQPKENTQTESTQKEKSNEFKEKLQVDSETLQALQETEVAEELNTVLEQIQKQYNSQYPDTPIALESLGIIESLPQYLIKQENEDGTISYLHETVKDASTLPENQTIYDQKLGPIYAVVNKVDHTILLSEGRVNYETQDIKTKKITINGQEYVAGDKQVQMEFESEAAKTEFYLDLQHKLNEIVEQQEER